MHLNEYSANSDQTHAKPLRKEWRDSDGKLMSRRRKSRALAEMRQLQPDNNPGKPAAK